MQRYESPQETEAAVERIHAQFEHTKSSLNKMKEADSGTDALLKSTLQSLLDARKAITSVRKELGSAIAALRRISPRK